jgi:hypothetical protein
LTTLDWRISTVRNLDSNERLMHRFGDFTRAA